MAISAFIPEVWSAQLLVSLKKALVYGALANRNYEGEIANYGDTVHITSISRPTISDYVANSTAITPEAISDAGRTLIVDQSKYFAFSVDDVDQRQARGDVLAGAMVEAAYGLADVADQFIAGFYTGVQSANNLGTVNVAGATDPVASAYLQLVTLAQKLHRANVSAVNRWCVIPPEYHSLLLQDARFTNAAAHGTPTSEPASVSGFVGRVVGMDIHMSNNVPNPSGTNYVIMAGTNDAISYAEQISKVVAYQPHSAFSDAVKGLHLYGGKLVRPDGIAVLTATL